MPVASPYISTHQLGDLLLSGQIQDLGANAQGGSNNGEGVFLAPCAGRLMAIYGTCENGNNGDVTLRIRVRSSTGNIPYDPGGIEIPVQSEGQGWQVALSDSDAIDVAKGSVIEIQSNGGGSATGRAYIYIQLRPAGGDPLPASSFVITGCDDTGDSAFTYDWPSIGDIEVLEFMVGNQVTTVGTYGIELRKNGSGATPIAVLAHPAGSVSYTTSGRILGPNRFIGKEDHIRVDSDGAQATALAKLPYAIICRRN